jgi:cell division protein FtsA
MPKGTLNAQYDLALNGALHGVTNMRDRTTSWARRSGLKKGSIASIDIGTAKVCTIMASLDENSVVHVQGFDISPSHGMEKGLVVDASAVRDSVRQSVSNAEIMSGLKLKSACVSLSGRHLHSSNGSGLVSIPHRNHEVRTEDVERAFKIAVDSRAGFNQKLLNVTPRSYYLDGNLVENPVGMHGLELKAEANFIAADMSSVQNLVGCVMSSGITIDSLVPSSLASAEAVLREEEKETGVIIADIGGGTTDVAVIKEGRLYHSSVLPAAGELVTRDIATGLSLPFEVAEDIKKKYGSAFGTADNHGPDQIEYQSGSAILRQDLFNIIRARLEELVHLIILELLVFEVPRVEYRRLVPSGIVITGGCARMAGIAEMANDITHLQARVGRPPVLIGAANSILNDPVASTGVGLLLWHVKNRSRPKWLSKIESAREFWR